MKDDGFEKWERYKIVILSIILGFVLVLIVFYLIDYIPATEMFYGFWDKAIRKWNEFRRSPAMLFPPNLTQP